MNATMGVSTTRGSGSHLKRTSTTSCDTTTGCPAEPPNTPAGEKPRDGKMTENTKRVAGHYAGGEEVAAYAPVPDVLFQLVKYWYWLLLGREWDYFLTGCSGQGKEAAFARRCIALAAKAIGEAAVERAIEEARDEIKA